MAFGIVHNSVEKFVCGCSYIIDSSYACFDALPYTTRAGVKAEVW